MDSMGFNFNKFNIPTWAMERDGYLFVRTYVPRLNFAWVDVIKGGTIADLPPEFPVVDVGEIYDKID